MKTNRTRIPVYVSTKDPDKGVDFRLHQKRMELVKAVTTIDNNCDKPDSKAERFEYIRQRIAADVRALERSTDHT